MSVKNILKLAPLALAATAFNSHAGVSATSYLEINDLFILIDTDGDNQADPVDPTQFIQILDGTREGNTNANLNGATGGDAVVTGATGDADADLVCVGPDCAGMGLVNNDQTLDNGNLVASDALEYAISDMAVTGDALGAGASGFTYSDVGLIENGYVGSASSQIFNNILSQLTLSISSAVNIAFVASYDVFVDAVISPDVTMDPGSNATASAEASFSIDLDQIGGTQNVINDGLSFSDFAFDLPGLGDLTQIEANDAVFFTGFVSAAAGTYQLAIAQDSDVQASLLPEPGSLAMLGLGLLGLGLRQRRKG